jgi:pimeloyl-ACP methyl ester carboxylesterase
LSLADTLTAIKVLSTYAARVIEHSVEGEVPLTLIEAEGEACGRVAPVLFVHGTTFPSGLASCYRFDDGSWADSLVARELDVWALDFAGYGRSGRYPELSDGADSAPPLGRSPVAAEQIARAVEHIRSRRSAKTVSVIAHSWGTLAAGRYVAGHPGVVERLVLFGPITRREALQVLPNLPAYQDVTIEEQRARFDGEVPDGHPTVFDDFDRWATAYRATDAGAEERRPPAVRIPAGPAADIMAAWAGYFPYEPPRIRCPVLLIRGEWDTLCNESDASWLTERLTGTSDLFTHVVGQATHVMHLERARHELHAATADFLDGVSQDAPRGG